jgi:thymidylate kinase
MKLSKKGDKVKSLFVCFTGIDGSGKTTLAKSTVTTLCEAGIAAKYVYNRCTPKISLPFMILGQKIFLRKKDMFKDYSDHSKTKKNLSRKYSFLSKAYQSILLFDCFIQTFIRIKIPLMTGQNIVCDRYIYDTIITDLAVDFNYSEEDVRKTLKLMLILLPAPDRLFFVDLPEEIAYSRKTDVASIDYLRDRRLIYQILKEGINTETLNGTLKPVDLNNIVKTKINSLITKQN